MAKTLAFKLEILGTEKQYREMADLEKEIQKLAARKKELQAAQKKGRALTEGERREIERINTQTKNYRQQKANLAKTTRAAADATKYASGSYRAMQQQLSSLTAKYRMLSRAERENVNVGGKMKAKINGLDKELKELDAGMGQHHRNVGNYTGALSQGLGRVGGAFQSLQGTVQTAGAAIGAFVVILGGLTLALGSGFKVIKQYDESLANLAAISQASDAQLSKLDGTAKALGATTQFTASQVVELETELAKLGFTTDQIIAATDSVLALAAASKTDLANAAAVAGNVIRGFGMQASETRRVADVMAASFSKSALDINKFATAMSQVAPVANNFNFTIEDTTALLAQLVNAGFDASKAGTALRNIILNHADSNGAERSGF